MKKVLIFLLLLLLLTGCGAQETFETVEDMVPVEPVVSPSQFFVSLPEEAAAPTFQDENGEELYICGSYTISKQILDGGDLQKTLMSVTGKSREELELIQTRENTWDRYDFVWTSAGEEGLQLGRACILDDGNYHYVLSTLTKEESASDLTDVFSDMYASCSLLDPELNLDTGS